MDRLFADVPIWGVFVGTLVLVLVSVEAGYRWARRRQKDREMEKEAPVGAMVGATLGLLAFLLAFTFGIAADAFHARKVALVQEANAIRMTYLLTGAIPEEHRSEIRTDLREYAEERLRWANGQQVMLAVAIAFSAVIMVIADLDRPGQGFINVSQQPPAGHAA